jgi:hypothetical protein
MANYVLVYKGGAMGQTEAERNQIMAAWGQWFGALGQDVVDGGNPFGPSKSIFVEWVRRRPRCVGPDGLLDHQGQQPG